MQGHVLSRRELLRRTSGLALAAVAAPFVHGSARAATRSSTSYPIQHVLVCCNENRSFDHYYGFAPFAGSFGVPADYSQPDGAGGTVTPHHILAPTTTDPAHDWAAMHAEWDNGAMDGFYTTDGRAAMGYYTGVDLPYYYSLFKNFTLCGNYFCSQLGPTYPNRLYLAGGTSGGNTTNAIATGSLSWPIILDLLDTYGITWKVYHVGLACTVNTQPACDNQFQFFQAWWQDPRVNDYSELDYYSDLASSRLPQVSFIMTKDENAEHPPFTPRVGQTVQKSLIQALMRSTSWSTAAYFLTYDESGGFFEHVLPPAFDAYGAGFRVPTWVISPYAKKAHVEGALYEHSSILKFIETIFGLPTLASINHQFDTQTPSANNDAANGQPLGPPAPPRDGRTDIGSMLECFIFAT